MQETYGTLLTGFLSRPGTQTMISGSIASVIGAFFSAQSAKNTLRHQAKMNKINAEISELGARSAMLQGQRKEQALRLGVANMKGTQRASYAARGVALDSGSVQNTLNTTDYMGEVDALTIQSNTLRAAWGYRMTAMNELNAASMARADARGISPFTRTVTSLLGSASQLSDYWNQYLEKAEDVETFENGQWMPTSFVRR